MLGVGLGVESKLACPQFGEEVRLKVEKQCLQPFSYVYILRKELSEFSVVFMEFFYKHILFSSVYRREG